MAKLQKIKAAEQMAVLMKQANEINFRPFVQIEGLQADQIASIAANGPKRAKRSDPARSTGYVTALTPSGDEYLL